MEFVGVISDWGSTAAERGDDFPCDALLGDPDTVLHRAVDVAASPATLFRWMCQLRVAPYSYDWIDNYGRRSPRALTPGLERLEIGQRVMRIFRLAAFAVDRHMTLVLDDRTARRVFGDIAGTYRVAGAPSGSRLVVRLRIRRPSGAFRWLAPLLPAGELIMMRKQLLELRRLAEDRALDAREPVDAADL